MYDQQVTNADQLSRKKTIDRDENGKRIRNNRDENGKRKKTKKRDRLKVFWEHLED